MEQQTNYVASLAKYGGKQNVYEPRRERLVNKIEKTKATMLGVQTKKFGGIWLVNYGHRAIPKESMDAHNYNHYANRQIFDTLCKNKEVCRPEECTQNIQQSRP